MTVHDLKCWPEFYEDIRDGRKTFEVRVNDRGFAVGDILRLREYRPKVGEYTGRATAVRITYIADLGPIGVPGFVGMGIER